MLEGGVPHPEDKLHEDSLIGHLADLRNCLLRALIAVAVVFFALFAFADEIYGSFARPLLVALPEGSELIATGVLGPFLVPFKVTLFVAFCVCLPYILYQVWKFVAPGLYAREKRLVLPLVLSSTALFYLGMAFAYLLVFRVVFGFIVSFAPEAISVMPDVQSHLSFALTIFMTFGLAFEMPVAVYLLVRMGVIEIAALRRARPYVLAGSFVLAAIVTPPDVLSQIMLAVPMWLLFEIGLLVASVFGGKKKDDKTSPD